jgi:HlyD family secretion protein
VRYLICLIFVFLMACDGRPQNIALGTLERDRIAHTATINEVVVELPVAQGSLVKKGTLLVKLDDTIQKAQVSKTQAEVVQAEAHLEKLRNGARVEDVAAAVAKVAGAKASLIESEANYKRAIELRESKTISEAARDKTLASRDADRASLQSAQEELRKLTNGTREEDLLQARAQLDAAIATLASEKKKLADLTILATRDGILDNLPWNLGERVTTGSPLAIVLAGKAPHARIYVPEPYRVKVKVGDELVVHVDGLEQPLTGQLRWIATEPAFTPYYALNQEERSRLMYLAEVQLPDSQAHLPNGVPAQVELP